MTNVEQKYHEFREAFRDDVLNGNVECKISKQGNLHYNAEITFKINELKLCITIADEFVCYHDKVIEGVFNKNDIKFLNKMVNDYFSKDKEKYDRIEKLKNEIYKLESEVA